MATNKFRIELLEEALRGLQDNASRKELGFNGKPHQMEAAISRISKALLAKWDTNPSPIIERNDQSSNVLESTLKGDVPCSPPSLLT